MVWGDVNLVNRLSIRSDTRNEAVFSNLGACQFQAKGVAYQDTGVSAMRART